MIVLDTNVISEAMKPAPHPAVRAWLDKQPAETLYLTTITLAEMLFGIRTLPAGQRKENLTVALDGLITLFKGRILTFDLEAAKHYANLAATAKSAGRGFPTPDGYIAAIAASRKYLVASRDTAPYLAASVSVLNPWND